MADLQGSTRDPRDCGCSPAFQQPKPNGTCATCGGWLPGERPAPLPWTNPGGIAGGVLDGSYDTPCG